VNAGTASASEMLSLIADVRERVSKAFGVTLEHEVVLWLA
jgi:UDP-N-acetylenolpyruvoylglucosamine reductase